ncbi:MAG: pyridoxal-phosphate dependent enzyme [Candidatus Promineofilum sp.]|nr:pyridoxal-phosphate dependent enzyme [Promineifilum sp.]
MIDLTINEAALERTVQRARERNIIIPTFAQQRNPELIPDPIKRRLADVGLWDLDPLNLFRITWRNEPVAKGGGFGDVNYLELPKEITGVDARIVVIVGKWFPTGSHKVGAAYGCLVPRLVTGQFDPTTQKAVWPSTGNYCRGGAYDSHLLACDSVAILPEGMSKERFEWLQGVAGEIIRTPGTESNVKEIFDKCWELRRSGEDLVIFNQFDEMGNYLWHYSVTAPAMHAILKSIMGPNDTFRGMASQTGSAGTIASGDYLKEHYPHSVICASEALQCPTLLNNGFGAHRIEGIGDKHVPWVHNVKNTDLVAAIDDNAAIGIMRLFNEEIGKDFLADQGVSAELIEQLPLLGISGIGNVLSAIKMAKYYEMGPNDVVMTIATDSMEMYGSRVEEDRELNGPLNMLKASGIYHRYLMGEDTNNLIELTYTERKRIHNLKYYTWIEQQGKTSDELNAQWYDPTYWTNLHGLDKEIDKLTEKFNERVGLLAQLS